MSDTHGDSQITSELTATLHLPTIRAGLKTLFFIGLWFGTENVAANRAWYPQALNTVFGTQLTFNEFLLLVVLLCGIVLLLVHGSISFPSSRLHFPVVLFSTTLLVPYVRMMIAEGTVRIPIEMHAGIFYVAYADVFLLFTAAESKQLFSMLLIIAAVKSIEACLGFALHPEVQYAWGALTEWRDGMLLGIGLLTWMTVYAYRTGVSSKMFYWASAGFLVAIAGFILSLRRSFIVAIPVAGIAMCAAAGGVPRKRIAIALFGVLAAAIVAAFVIHPAQVLPRMEDIGSPLGEFSATYRLFEYKNVLLNIAHAPWFGYPMGTPWKIYTVFPFTVLSPLVPHDIYLYLALRNGIAGIVLFLMLAAAIIRCIGRIREKTQTVFDRIAVLSFTGWSMLFAVAAITAPLLMDSRISALAGVIVALIGLFETNLRNRAGEWNISTVGSAAQPYNLRESPGDADL